MAFPHDLLREIFNKEETSRAIRSKIRSCLEPVEVDYRGSRMFVHPTDNNTEFQIWRMGRTHEEKALRNILKMLGDKPFYALDVGANAGSFSVRLGVHAAKGSEVHAFEPNPVMRSRLIKNLSLNQLDNVIVHDCAISDEAGEMTLHIPEEVNLGQARLNEPFKAGAKCTVQVRKLTDFLPKDPSREIDFLKVDIEGFEDRAIGPLLSETPISRRPKYIFFEHKHNILWKTDINQKLYDSGYEMFKEYGRNALLIKGS